MEMCIHESENTNFAPVCHYTDESQAYHNGNNPTMVCESNLVSCVNKILSQHSLEEGAGSCTLFHNRELHMPHDQTLVIPVFRI